MNKQPIHIQTSSTSDTRTVLSDASTNSVQHSPPKTFIAKNVVIKSDSLQMDVELNGRWQPMRLAIKNGSAAPSRIELAHVTVANNGQTLTLNTPEQSIQVKAANELMALVNLLKGLHPSTSLQQNVSVIHTPNPQLQFKKLGINLAINPALSEILKNESKLVANIQAAPQKVTFTLLNQFKDPLLTGAISKQKFTELLASNKVTPFILVDKQDIQVKFSQSQQSFTLTNTKVETSNITSTAKWQQASITKHSQGINIAAIPQKHALTLAQPIKSQFSDIQPLPNNSSISNTHKPMSDNTLGYNKPLVNITFQDIKDAVKSALNNLIAKPFESLNQKNQTTTTMNTDSNIAKNSQHHQKLPTTLDTTLVLRSASRTEQAPIVHLLSRLSTVIQSLSMQSPLMATEKLSSLVLSTNNAYDSRTDWSALKHSIVKPTAAPLLNFPNELPPSRMHYEQLSYTPKLPIERALLKTILGLEKQPSPAYKDLPTTQILTQKIDAISHFKSSDSVDLTRLVHNAFNRMIDEKNISAPKILHELQPHFTQFSRTPIRETHGQSSNNYTQALDKLLVTLLAAPKATQGFSEDIQLERLHSLLKTLSPEFKGVQSKQLLQNLPQLNSQLLDDLIKINNAHQTNLVPSPSATKFDSDAQLLLSLFMPMKLPPECKQTELQIGQYKKKAKENMPEKTVWFIRLNFDYAQQGKISAHAELMDKALECELLGTTAQVCNLAAPHIDGLRRKLSAHGLQVSEIVLNENAEQVDAFFDSHAIVNIQV
ncbi:hypothetical protein [Pseudoalteromonas sp. MMG012]|uniref:hypothetical protein n=1 Tax=Pseudoalteromonas sp. MMG012 TaxID=2822686 RepID=UPI001B3A658C|nr:hypothetical protein [Pseudoalteromonas sp. MMG012]MBQ4849065.1 hypothetical protein [Pseudoalteromonas sp. MMG012]